VTEEALEYKAGHRTQIVAPPGAVWVLAGFEPIQGSQHRSFHLRSTAAATNRFQTCGGIEAGTKGFRETVESRHRNYTRCGCIIHLSFLHRHPMVFSIRLVRRAEVVDGDLELQTVFQTNFNRTFHGVHADHFGLDQLAAVVRPDTHLCRRHAV
jgi:hypothetical protein